MRGTKEVTLEPGCKFIKSPRVYIIIRIVCDIVTVK